MRPTRTQAIKQFLLIKTHTDLAGLYNHNMEVQVNVAQDNGERVDGDFKGKQWHGYTDGSQVWKAIRIPYKANTSPEYIDTEMSYDLAIHAEGIGMTGWDWVNKISRWVAYDFDAISGHSPKHGKKLTNEELEALRQAIEKVEWVTLRKSTSGTGLHLYVFLEPVATANHNEHAALARAILGKLSQITNYAFESKVDTCGGNMWVWHRKMEGTDGLTLLKEGICLDTVPPNWKDHLKVIRNKRSKSLPKFIEDQQNTNPEVEDDFEKLCGQRLRIPIDSEHKRLMDWLEVRYPNAHWWDQDGWFLVTHTSLLQEAHVELELKGIFKTLATGSEKGSDHNCFLFPLKNGAWSVRRFTPGTGEAPSWQQDGVGWTYCFINKIPDFKTACRHYGAIEDPAGGYIFDDLETAKKVALLLKADLDAPIKYMQRKCKLKIHKSGRLYVEMKQESGDPPLENWCGEKHKWSKLFNIKSSDNEEPEVATFDEEVRHLVTETGEDYGWTINSEGAWHNEPFHHIKSYLKARGHSPAEVEMILGAGIARYWTIVNLPFREEYPADRKWNRGAAKLKYVPTENRDSLKYDNWMRMLRHCGSGLDEAISNNEWCKSNGILNGGDYLKCWISSLFKHPMVPLPYLFFYGPEGSGKSIFHEALSLLITNGIVRADTALTSQGNFNGELEHAIVCVVEETDLRKDLTAYNRIKDWVTSVRLPIHKKQKQPYSVLNTTHWIQTANKHLYCPVFPGDTRITMSYVGPLDSANLIPKKVFLESLEKEAPDFLAEILNLELPPCTDRLNIPIIVTEDKQAAGQANVTFLELFLQERCHPVDGKKILLSEFFNKFQEWLDPNYCKEWTKIKVGRELPPHFPKGRLPQSGQFYIGNIDWVPKNPEEAQLLRLILKDGFLVSAPLIDPLKLIG